MDFWDVKLPIWAPGSKTDGQPTDNPLKWAFDNPWQPPWSFSEHFRPRAPQGSEPPPASHIETRGTRWRWCRRRGSKEMQDGIFDLGCWRRGPLLKLFSDAFSRLHMLLQYAFQPDRIEGAIYLFWFAIHFPSVSHDFLLISYDFLLISYDFLLNSYDIILFFSDFIFIYYWLPMISCEFLLISYDSQSISSDFPLIAYAFLLISYDFLMITYWFPMISYWLPMISSWFPMVPH